MKPEPMPLQVLVVDDDEMSRELLTVLLEAEGYAVHTADSGESALEHLRSAEAPDIVLTDMQLPGISGEALARELRARTGERAMLLAMSGSEPAAEVRARFDAFLLKPFGVRQLASAMEQIDQTRADASARRSSGSGKVVPISSSHPEMSQIDLSAAAESVQPANATPVLNEKVPVLNEKIFDQLTRALPGKQLREMYTLSLNDTRDRIGRMRQSVHDRDSDRFVREAHAIKGSAGMLGASQIHTLAADLETHGLSEAGTGTSSVNSLDELSAACDRLERMLSSRA